ncbi:MAG: histone deacetylase [Candidatus Zixiibacteriota bacterium]
MNLPPVETKTVIGYYSHKLFQRHLEGFGHVESPERLRAINTMLDNSPVRQKLTVVESSPAELEWLTRVHDAAYVDSILSLNITDPVLLDWGDTVATSDSPHAALYAAGAGVQACRAVLKGEYDLAFCAVRPPGHHAERDRAMGFCIFNNVAVAAADLLESGALSRVAIVDWDVHHGNGTERMFVEDDRVLYISLHQYPHYPGSGHASMTGKGKGVGYTMNLPISAGAGDDEYRAAFETRVIPALDAFKPEFVLISAGFDAHRDDPLAEINLSSAIFGELTRMLKACARKHCGGMIVSMLEGGYNLRALAESVECHLQALAE